MNSSRGAAWAWAGAGSAGLLLLASFTAPHVGYPMGVAWVYMMAALPALVLFFAWSLARRHKDGVREISPRERQV